MRSDRDPERMTEAEALDFLNIGRKTLREWQASGILRPCNGDDPAPLYRRREVQALSALREAGPPSAKTAWLMALQALATAKSLEVRMAQIMDSLGLCAPILDRSRDGIWELGCAMTRTPSLEQRRDPDWVRYWAGTLFGIDENYLALVGVTTCEHEPWKPYVDFCAETLEAAHSAEVLGDDIELRRAAAYRYLEAAQRHLTYVGYLFCRHRYGGAEAERAFKGRPSIVEELFELLV